MEEVASVEPITQYWDMDGTSSLQNVLFERYKIVRQQSVDLSASLTPEDCQIQSMPDASPVKWHLAHTTWFWETFLLKPHHAGYEVFDPAFDYLFNSYYEAIGPRHSRPRRGLITRPTLDLVYAYRRFVDAAMEELLLATDDRHYELVELGLAHEEQHQELIQTDIKHALWQNPMRLPNGSNDQASVCSDRSAIWQLIEGGLVELGNQNEEFCFDNEGPFHKAWLEPYELATSLVTNREYLQFMEDGGYSTASLWLSDGWMLANQDAWQAPLYWEMNAGEWWEFTPRGMRLIDFDAPVRHVSFFEAAAYAEWSDYRLPSEAEWEHAASSQGQAFADLFGSVWQWTRSDYSPYPGYRVPKGAIGEYNGKFMSGQYVLRGSSSATAPNHARISYRNFFPAHSRWQFSGIRLAKDP